MLNLQILVRRIGKTVCWSNFSSSTAPIAAARLIGKSESTTVDDLPSSSSTSKLSLANKSKSKILNYYDFSY